MNTQGTPAGSTSVIKDDDRGTTTITDNVVAKIVGIATVKVPGVYAVGGGAARAMGSIREVLGQHDLGQGIKVEVGHTQVAVDLNLVVDYPHPLQEVAENVRDAVYGTIEDLVGMEVTEVNVVVSDIHIPEIDDVEAKGPRVS